MESLHQRVDSTPIIPRTVRPISALGTSFDAFIELTNTSSYPRLIGDVSANDTEVHTSTKPRKPLQPRA